MVGVHAVRTGAALQFAKPEIITGRLYAGVSTWQRDAMHGYACILTVTSAQHVELLDRLLPLHYNFKALWATCVG